MTQPHVLELAKQGDPEAIATLMNQSLQPRGMTALVDRQGDVLEVVLEAERVPNRDALTAFVQKGIDNLGIESIRSIRIVGQQAGATFPAWMQELSLATDLFSEAEIAPLDTAPDPYAEPSASPESRGFSDPDVQNLEIPDLSFSEGSPPLPESGLDDLSTLDLSPLEFDDRPEEASIDLLTTDSQQLALEEQLKTLWSEDQGSDDQPGSDELLGNFSLDASEPISESEFQDLFAEDSPETIAPEPADRPSIEDLFTDTDSEATLENASESRLDSTSSIDDLFAETPSAPAIEDLFEDSSIPGETLSGETLPAADERSDDPLFGESDINPISERSTDLFGEPLTKSDQALPDAFQSDTFQSDAFQTFFTDDDSLGSEASEESTLFDGEDFTTAPLSNFVAEESSETPVDFFDEELDTEESLDSTDLSDLFGDDLFGKASHETTLPHETTLQGLDEPASLSNESESNGLDLSSLEDISSENLFSEEPEPAELDFSSDFSLEDLSIEAPSATDTEDAEPPSAELSSPEEITYSEGFVGDLPDDFFAEAAPESAVPDLTESGLMSESEPIASGETLQAVPDDLFTEELQGLHETPIEYVFGEEVAPETRLEEASLDIAPEPEAEPDSEPESRGNWLAGLAGLGSGAVAASSVAGSSNAEEVPGETLEEARSLELDQHPDQQALETQIDNLWAEQTEEPTFELEEEPIHSLESSSDLSFDWEAPAGESSDLSNSLSENDRSAELTDDSLADLFGDEPLISEPLPSEPMLLLEDTVEAPPTGDLALDGDLPAIEEIPMESADLDESFLAEMAEAPTLPPADDWMAGLSDELMPSQEPLPTEEIPMESADLDESFLAEMAEEPTLLPADDWTDDLFLEQPSTADAGLADAGLTELADTSEESIDLSDFDLSETSVDPANPMEGSIPSNELLLDLEDESSLTDLSAEDYPLIDDFSRPSADEPAIDESSPDASQIDSFGTGFSEAALMALPSDLIDETPDEPIANLLHDPVQDDLGIDFLGEDPTTAASLPPVMPLTNDFETDDFEAELAGLTLEDLPESDLLESDLPESDLRQSNWLESDLLEEMPSSSTSDAEDNAIAEPGSSAGEPDLDLALDFLDPTAQRGQSFANEADDSFDLPDDLLNQFDEPQFGTSEEAIDFLDQEPEPDLFPEDSSALADALPAEARSADETDIDFLTEPPASTPAYTDVEGLDDFEEAQVTDSFGTSESWLTDSSVGSADSLLDSPAAPSDPADEFSNLALDANAFNEEAPAIADTNGWETESWNADESLPLSEGVESNGMSEAAVVAAGLVGAGAAVRGQDGLADGLADGTIGNGRDYAPARAIESTGSPWLYTFVLLSVSGLIAGLLGYSLWSEVVSPRVPAPSTAPAPKASSLTGGLLEQVAQATDTPAA